MSNFRMCRCGCNQRMPIYIHFESGKILERKIKCGYCGDVVDQNNTNYKTGKWYHDQCMSDYKNFYASLTSRQLVGLKSEIVQAFRDYILFQMIMRKDVRLFHYHWKIVVRGKAIPVILKPIRPERLITA